MRTFVRLFESAPRGPLVEQPGFSLEARDIDAARAEARRRLEAWGYAVRALNVTTDTNLTAIVRSPS